MTCFTPLAISLVASLVSPQVAGSVAGSASVDRARADFEAGRYADAASALESATKGNTEDAVAAYWLGRVRLEQRNYHRAIDAFARAVHLSSSNSEYHRWLARAEAEVADREHSILMARRVRKELEQSVRLDASNVAARRDLQGFYLEAPWLIGGSESKAWSQAGAIAALDPVAGHLARAAYWAHKKDVARAKAEYGAMVDARPRDVAPYLEAAVFYESADDSGALRAVIDLAEQIDQREPQLMYFRGVLGVLTGAGLDGAEEALTAYLDRVTPRSDRPDPSAAHDWLGRLYEAVGHLDRAATEFRKALALEPGRKSARDNLKRLEQRKE